MGKWATVKNFNDDFMWNEGWVPIFLRNPKTGTYVWHNPKPGGATHLRPTKKSAKKDTAEAVLEAVQAFEAERAALVPFTHKVGEKTVTVHYTVHPSMHDGANIKVSTLHNAH